MIFSGGTSTVPMLAINESTWFSLAPDLIKQLYNLKCKAKSFNLTLCFFSSKTNSLAESNSELSSPILKLFTILLTVPSPTLLSIAILALESPANHCCITFLLIDASIGAGIYYYNIVI
jgi:hypothetical protein